MANVYDIIIRPIITERSMEATGTKKYVFEVARCPSRPPQELEESLRPADPGLQDHRVLRGYGVRKEGV